MDIYLRRLQSGDEGTFGKLTAPDFSCFTLEPPWRNNAANKSCIRYGVYNGSKITSAKFGTVLLIHEVPNRTAVLIHTGNLAGDEAKGFRTHSHGCILVGQKFGRLGGQQAVLCSRPAMTALLRVVPNKFRLHISGVKMFYNNENGR